MTHTVGARRFFAILRFAIILSNRILNDILDLGSVVALTTNLIDDAEP